MLRMLLVLVAFGVGSLWGVTHIVCGYALLLWNDLFRPAEWARNYGVLNPATFPSHKFCWVVFAISAVARPWPKRWNLGAAGIAALLAWMWICRAFSPYPEVAHEEAIKATKYLVPALLASVALVDRQKQHLILYVICFSVAIWGAWAGLHAGILLGAVEIGMSIPGGQMTDRNDFLVAATGTIPLLAYVGWHYEGPKQRWVRFGAKCMLPALLLAFLMGNSRGAILGLVGLGLFYSALTGRFFRRFAFVCVIGVALVLIAPDTLWKRLETINVESEQTELSAKNRLEHMRTAVLVTVDRPVFGVGPDGFPYESQKYGPFTADPHSVWLKCSSEYGAVGLAGFLLLISVLTRRLLQIAKRARAEKDGQTEALAIALCCGYVGFLASGTFTSQFLSEFMWAIIGLAGAFVAAESSAPRTPRAGLDDCREGKAEASEGDMQVRC